MSHQITQFHLMAKPSGSVCNIDCSYCFYLEKDRLYPERKNRWKMDGTTLDNYVRKNIQGQAGERVDFIWQGGEPTMLGIDFFREAVRLQQYYRGNKKINNFFQTNGINIDDDWAVFFKDHRFLVGVSIDGDRISNDKYRLSRSGRSTHDEVLRGIKTLLHHGIEFNTLTVVNAENVKRPLDVYNFLKRIGSRYMQFIPLVERRAASPDANGLTLVSPDFTEPCRVTEWSVPAKAYGNFLNAIFDHWVVNDLGSIFVMNFEQTMAKMAGQTGSCVINETCGGNLIVEANGDVYSCDHFVYPEHKLGNINQTQPERLVNSAENINFGQSKLTNISKDCLNCSVRPVCNGGCPKHRFNLSSDGRPNKNYFCEGFSLHLNHALPMMDCILQLTSQRTTPGKIKKTIKQIVKNGR
ncbi:anaerobic sulfatase maturase [Serratia entomophila]|uniref:anaerobic sulfatase maturase n=1 Tax=Serratia entomophila TaxID=42906 RepID=UPI00217B6DE5|nr:anaerobic sulfatase maturase [Serratia entomophila]CAI0779891.1 Anaerobic sulfatase-maturating enzyme homolog YdeM [Serratia entomophila]CAI1499742.1 Anaerobic sulfatase-maturating enzyme homolog YdeM [Serratia entomophila]CAI1507352.1 Anaerobic sulfatase-maturating enzyme homolog YdeM [Serratia entomophila]CAI1511010.1 Anaerobic sulfatase-maturating enzyme homolog YdeM [Serratia entomophila]CAI1607089.1 Anaerobic sulfatase-maturating enzyme homolog YdeM [Serratia entomophila]